ncbi:MAG: TetR/AcrR family transcriptional regulator [Myxococcota bacterium]|jgi:AcrR family transcriptional regulator|nr:TetR/AcrR family transcriptional regulator [Myxococcota bacterium]
MSSPPRRTQRERREETIAKLLDATIECLIDHGYRDTSIGRICTRAGVSHGGLFRHFSSRNALLAAATDEVGRRHLVQLHAVLASAPEGRDVIDTLVHSFREATRSPLTAAWREVLLAARTNEELRVAVQPAVQNFETAIMDIAVSLPSTMDDPRALGTLLLSLLHVFDSESTTWTILQTEDVLQIRHDWAVKLLREAFGG